MPAVSAKSQRRCWQQKARRVLAVFLGGRRSGKTATAYKADLEAFRGFLEVGERQDAAARLLAAGSGGAFELASRWMGILKGKTSASTVNRRLATLRSLTQTARNMGVIEWELRIPNLKARAYRDTRGPGREAYRRMLALVAGRGGSKAARDGAILHLVYDLALRRGEVVGLEVVHVDLQRGAVSVLGKGRTEREWLELPQETLEALAVWLAMRGPEDGPLFTSYSHAQRGKGLSDGGLYWLVRQVSTAAGARTSPHGLRHSAITDALRMGHSPVDVQRFSRHASLNTLQIYYDQVKGTAADIAQDVARRPGNLSGGGY